MIICLMCLFLFPVFDNTEGSYFDWYRNRTVYWRYNLEDLDSRYRYGLDSIAEMYTSYQEVLKPVQSDHVLLNVPQIGQVSPELYM